MPLYMDIHQHVEGLTAEAVAQAHEQIGVLGRALRSP